MGTPNRKLAVITGASGGVGLRLAEEHAKNGFDLVICAEDDAIAAAGVQLAAHGGRVDVVQADLAGPDGVETLCATIDELDRPVDALVLVAGGGVGGTFVDVELDDELEMIARNCSSVVHLARRVLPAMIERGVGHVTIVPVEFATEAPHSVHDATRAFELIFAEGLRRELADSGVSVSVIAGDGGGGRRRTVSRRGAALAPQ
jgi:uncharacterized protein